MRQVVVPVFVCVGYLVRFGVLRGHALETVIFWGTSEAPTVFSAEIPCVMYARFLWIIIRNPRGPRGVEAYSNCVL